MIATTTNPGPQKMSIRDQSCLAAEIAITTAIATTMTAADTAILIRNGVSESPFIAGSPHRLCGEVGKRVLRRRRIRGRFRPGLPPRSACSAPGSSGPDGIVTVSHSIDDAARSAPLAVTITAPLIVEAGSTSAPTTGATASGDIVSR